MIRAALILVLCHVALSCATAPEIRADCAALMPTAQEKIGETLVLDLPTGVLRSDRRIFSSSCADGVGVFVLYVAIDVATTEFGPGVYGIHGVFFIEVVATYTDGKLVLSRDAAQLIEFKFLKDSA